MLSPRKEENDPTFVNTRRNPIIFARTETSHIPKTLQKKNYSNELKNTVYSVHRDGTLRQTPNSYRDEYGNDYLIPDEEPVSCWKRLFSFCRPKRRSVKQHAPSVEPIKKQKPEVHTPELPPEPFLGPQRACDKGKKTLVLDLDETLVHSTFQPSTDCQYVIPVEIDGGVYNVYVYRRPGALEFIRHMSELYEVIVYTASLKKYADPLLDRMDPDKCISSRLFRDYCVCSDGVFVKDLGLLGRDMKDVIMIDNAAQSYKFQPKNGIECTPFIDNFNDTELAEMTPFLEYLSKKNDVRQFARLWNDTHTKESQIIVYDD